MACILSLFPRHSKSLPFPLAFGCHMYSDWPQVHLPKTPLDSKLQTCFSTCLVHVFTGSLTEVSYFKMDILTLNLDLCHLFLMPELNSSSSCSLTAQHRSNNLAPLSPDGLNPLFSILTCTSASPGQIHFCSPLTSHWRSSCYLYSSPITILTGHWIDSTYSSVRS